MEISHLDSAYLDSWNRSVPRYTSYPTAPQFKAIDPQVFEEKIKKLNHIEGPLSIYIHIPFCRSMCLFCGCSVVLNRNPQKQRSYLDSLLQEIRQTASFFSSKKMISQLHLGGGTPTSLSMEEFDLLMGTIRKEFAFTETAEISIEVDPRTVFADRGEKLLSLKKLGFNRVSFGVQDLDPQVQEAVKRRQSEEMTHSTFYQAKELGFLGINIDLIYGLPLQTPSSFKKTVLKLIDLQPDRVSLFSYAKVPWIKKHQLAIRERDLPTSSEKFQIYVEARKAFIENGYTAIGMDHFALKEDPLAIAYETGSLFRNFQGYSVQKAENLLGFGLTSIGYIDGAYFQNVKEIADYQLRISQKVCPVFRGFILEKEDKIRSFVIQSLMCRFKVDKKEFERKFNLSFDIYFAEEKKRIDPLLIEDDSQEMRASSFGRLFIRLIACEFDQYLSGEFSKAL